MLPEPLASGASITSLTDAQVAHVLAQDDAQWADALPYILGTPASNRDLLRTRFAQGCILMMRSSHESSTKAPPPLCGTPLKLSGEN